MPSAPTSTPKSTTIVSPTNLVRFPSDWIPGDSIGYRFELTNTLQSTLDLQEQLELFQSFASDLVNFDGLIYRHTGQEVEIKLGEKAKHSCNYKLSTQSEKLGSLSFRRNTPFNEVELSELETMMSALVYPIRNALQYRMALQTALRDPLTKTGNRIALDNALHRELQICKRYEQNLSLMVIDIDFFKKINDTYGHHTGDLVLQQVAGSIQEVTRQTDMTFRYGGEEFVVVMSKTDSEGANIIAERVRDAIEKLTYEVDQQKINVSVSIGISQLKAKEHIDELFIRADHALYQAKNGGRNRVATEL
ncbi:GGDEF domain-containing protein [Aurantivibrio infirmus]